jgi:lipopolysaccharide transport system permease protein
MGALSFDLMSATDVFEPAQGVAADSPVDETPIDLPLWRPTTWERVREAWQSRELLPGLARTSIPSHQGQILGRGWLFLRPFMQIFGFAVVFGGVFHVKAPNGAPYLIFLILSMQAFRLFDTTLIYATISTNYVKNVTRPLRFPLLLIPFGAMGIALFRLAVYWGFAAVLLAYYAIADGHFYLVLGPKLLVGFAGTFLCLALGLAVGLTTSVLYPRAKDMRYFVRYSVQPLALITPVYYPLSTVPSSYRTLAEVNPLTGAVGLVQYGFLGGVAPGLYSVAWSCISLVLLTLFGFWFFNRFATSWLGVMKRQPSGELSDEDDEEL